ncbi:sugar transferase [Nocardioides dongkuii]|uniref:sugar transferase n=1 Tax=Nocardioides dongkuii TaxID=2760089 RepID=UPI0015F97967|nr:sugar transferase [Nocardioides dongkuii]
MPTAREAVRFIPLSAFLLDVVLIGGTALLATYLRQILPVFEPPRGVTESVRLVAPLLVAGWLLAIWFAGGYRIHLFGAGASEFKRILNASLASAGLLGVGCYLFNVELSRGFFFLLFALGAPALLLGRGALRLTMHRARRRGSLLHRVLIAGDARHVDEIAAVFRRERWLGYNIIGALLPQVDREETAAGVPVLGRADRVTSVALECGADIVFLAQGAIGSSNDMRELAWELEHEEVQVVVAPSITDISSDRVRMRPVAGLPLVHIDPPTAQEASRWGKRLFDMLGSAVLIVLFSPLFAVAALQIKRHDGGPVLFRHARIGREGREFPCLKFRTMVVDAEQRLDALQAETGQDALLFKMKADPRITRPGVWLRRFSVDELPQLFNVLRGEMSLVGPRPQVAEEVALYSGGMHRRLSVRPGMTGLWQVSGRNDLSLEEAIRLDIYYVDNWSMLQDLQIVGRTVGAVLRSRGAY